MAVMTKRSKVRKWSQNRAFVTNFYTRYVDLGLNWFLRCSHIIFVLFLSHLRDGTLGYPWGTPGQIRQKYHPRNLYNKSARKNEASLHGSLRPNLKNGVSPTRNHSFHECTKRAKVMKLIPKAGLLWLIMTPEMWTW